MAANVVTLLLGADQVSQLHARYPGCVLTNHAGTGKRFQEYRVVVPGRDDDDGCYHFLIHLTRSVVAALPDQAATVVGISGHCGAKLAEENVQQLAALIVKRIFSGKNPPLLQAQRVTECNNLSMVDFVQGRCRAVRDVSSFVDMWLKSPKNPCSLCMSAKEGCSFYVKRVLDGGKEIKEAEIKETESCSKSPGG